MVAVIHRTCTGLSRLSTLLRVGVLGLLTAVSAASRADAQPVAAGAPAVAPEAPTSAAPAASPPSSPEGSALARSREAYSFRPGEPCPFCVLTPQFPEGRSGLHWHAHWQPVGLREYVAAPSMLLAGLALSLVIPPPSRPRWRGPIVFDGALRDLLRFDSAGRRETAATISDALFFVEILHPTVVDPLIAAWWVRESPRVAWQMFVINAQAYAFTLLLNDVTKRLTARARPWVGEDDCERNPQGDACGSGGSYRSFYSGHAAITATGAGLICAHHTQLSLYQDPVLDVGTCLLAVAGTAVTGAMRISADNHWASDVLVGHLMGYVSGYLLPTLLYYREFRLAPHEHPDPGAPIITALPLVTPNALGLSLGGLF